MNIENNMQNTEQQEDLIQDSVDSIFSDEDENDDEYYSHEKKSAELKVTQQELEQVAEPAVLEVQEAKKHGYLTEDEYLKKHGSLEGFKSADQFNKYGKAWEEVSTVIKGMKKQLDERDKQIESLVQYNERIEERSKQKARAELEEQLRLARDNGDVQAVEDLSKEKAKMEFHAVQQSVQKLELERQTAEKQFIERNKHWFNIDPLMTNRAAQIAQMIHQNALNANQILDYTTVASQIEAQLKYEYPDKMVGAITSTPQQSVVVSPSYSSTNKVASTASNYNVDSAFNSLGKEHQSVFAATNKYLQRSGRKPYTKQEFINKLKNEGEI